jgi:NADH dehydrogenase
VVKRLAAAGHVVRVAVRDTQAALFLKPMGGVGQIVPLHIPVTADEAVARAVEGATLVVNLVGILTERRPGDFSRIHEEAAARIARLSAAAGVERLVHISAIGAAPQSPSRYGASKGRGEQAVRAAFPGATILRPSIVFGPEDKFFNRFGTMAQMLPIMPVVSGTTKLQPVYVGDVADAVIASLTRPDAVGATYELGGPEIKTFHEWLAWILHETQRSRPLIKIPACLARVQARILEKLPGKLLTRDQLLMLARDNVVSPDMPGLTELGIIPTPVDLIVPAYLRRFRPGGGRRTLAGQPA